MTERIDFALEPGVVVFAILFFVLVNVLLAAVLYPYFRSNSTTDRGTTGEQVTSDHVAEGASSDEQSLDDRVDEFLKEMEEEQ